MTLIKSFRHIAPEFQLRTQLACVVYLRVRSPHFFDRHPSGTLEAGKLRARANPVKSGNGNMAM